MMKSIFRSLMGFVVIAALLLSLFACVKKDGDETGSEPETSGTSNASLVNTDGTTQPENSEETSGTEPSVKDETVSSAGSTQVTLNGSGASVSGSVVTVTDGGTYTFSGSLSDGHIIVNAPKAEVTLIFKGQTSLVLTVHLCMFINPPLLLSI